MNPAPRWLVVGRIVAAFGTHGEVRLMPQTSFPDRFAPGRTLFVEGKEAAFPITASRRQKGQLVLKLQGVDDRETALELAGRHAQVPGDDLAPLAEGEFYLFQLTGLRVESDDGRTLGRLTEVLQTGANDVYVVKGEGPEVLLPATPEVIRDVNLEAGVMTVHLLPGLADT
ncbi:MAG: ribosome maturation factor RimM [Chloroflexota bacterium]